MNKEVRQSSELKTLGEWINENYKGCQSASKFIPDIVESTLYYKSRRKIYTCEFDEEQMILTIFKRGEKEMSAPVKAVNQFHCGYCNEFYPKEKLLLKGLKGRARNRAPCIYCREKHDKNKGYEKAAETPEQLFNKELKKYGSHSSWVKATVFNKNSTLRHENQWQKMVGRNDTSMRPIIVNAEKFDSLNDAAEHFGLAWSTVQNRVNSVNYPKWKYA
jgi:hypothetical protein